VRQVERHEVDKSPEHVTSAHQVGGEAWQKSDVIEIEGMMEAFAAIVVAVIVVPLVLLGIISVAVLTGFILSFL
jgi:hypothetical protein